MKLGPLLVLVCMATAAHAAEPEKFTLTYKPTSGAVEYWVRISERAAAFKPKQPPKWHKTDSLALVHHAATDAPDGKLKVALSTEAQSLMMEGKALDLKGKTPTDTFTYVMSKRGELADPAGAQELGALCSPVFPAEPVPVGHTWKVAVPATKKFRLPFEISHTFEAIKDVKGKKLAVIKSKARVLGRDEKSKAKAGLALEASALFDIAAGNWAKVRTSMDSSANFDKPLKDGNQMMLRGVLRVVTRREAGETAPPADK